MRNCAMRLRVPSAMMTACSSRLVQVSSPARLLYTRCTNTGSANIIVVPHAAPLNLQGGLGMWWLAGWLATLTG